MNRFVIAGLAACSLPAHAATDFTTIPLAGGTSTAGAFTLTTACGQPIAMEIMSAPGAVLVPGFLCIEPYELGVLGDLNRDGIVASSDLVLLLNAWGSVGGIQAEDLNSDGVVDGQDLTILLQHWSS